MQFNILCAEVRKNGLNKKKQQRSGFSPVFLAVLFLYTGTLKVSLIVILILLSVCLRVEGVVTMLC
ncbi:MAG TPA: hypothetical protein PLZ32_20865, partial [Saprospiraceae bacterium]|nr:hypothetical protein [Saprospiraceae bacterium]